MRRSRRDAGPRRPARKEPRRSVGVDVGGIRGEGVDFPRCVAESRYFERAGGEEPDAIPEDGKMSYLSFCGAMYEVFFSRGEGHSALPAGWYWQLRCEDPYLEPAIEGPFSTRSAAIADIRGTDKDSDPTLIPRVP